jgi:hypothetical protein
MIENKMKSIVWEIAGFLFIILFVLFLFGLIIAFLLALNNIE